MPQRLLVCDPPKYPKIQMHQSSSDEAGMVLSGSIVLTRHYVTRLGEKYNLNPLKITNGKNLAQQSQWHIRKIKINSDSRYI